MDELESLRAAVRAAEERSASLAAALAERDLRLANGNAQGNAAVGRRRRDPCDPGIEMEIAARERSIAQLQSRLDAEIEFGAVRMPRWQAATPSSTRESRSQQMAAARAEARRHDQGA